MDNTQKTTEFAWGILGNILASLLIALANILIGRFLPNAPSEVIDIISLVLPILFITLFLTRGHLRKIRLNARMISIGVVALVTILLIIGFGIAIRWLFEQRIETAVHPIYDVYRRIYDVTSP